MLLVLDSNEYIFGLGISMGSGMREPDCEKLIDILREKYPEYTIRIPRLIVAEVRKNLSVEIFKEFILFISELTKIDEDIVVPFEMAARYENLGLAPEDAFIAAYVEWVGADVLVSENRHFLSRRKGLPFRVLRARELLIMIGL